MFSTYKTMRIHVAYRKEIANQEYQRDHHDLKEAREEECGETVFTEARSISVREVGKYRPMSNRERLLCVKKEDPVTQPVSDVESRVII